MVASFDRWPQPAGTVHRFDGQNTLQLRASAAVRCFLALLVTGVMLVIVSSGPGAVLASEAPAPPAELPEVPASGGEPDAGAAASAPLVQRMGRISFRRGSVLVRKGPEADPFTATENLPIQPGDQLYTNPGSKAEVETDDGSVMRVWELTTFHVLELSTLPGTTASKTRIAVQQGSVWFHTPDPPDDGFFIVETPSTAFQILEAGSYRVDVMDSGKTVVQVYDGRVRLGTARGVTDIARNQQIEVYANGDTSPVTGLVWFDEDPFTVWDGKREERRVRPASSARYVPAEIPMGVSDLDDHGIWRYDPEYGYIWDPTNVDNDWRPYRNGEWRYLEPYGWTWVPAEPWGWAPFHYGSWVQSFGWGWVWVPGRVWSPAWVSWRYHGGAVTWVALHPYDDYYYWSYYNRYVYVGAYPYFVYYHGYYRDYYPYRYSVHVHHHYYHPGYSHYHYHHHVCYARGYHPRVYYPGYTRMSVTEVPATGVRAELEAPPATWQAVPLNVASGSRPGGVSGEITVPSAAFSQGVGSARALEPTAISRADLLQAATWRQTAPAEIAPMTRGSDTSGVVPAGLSTVDGGRPSGATAAPLARAPLAATNPGASQVIRSSEEAFHQRVQQEAATLPVRERSLDPAPVQDGATLRSPAGGATANPAVGAQTGSAGSTRPVTVRQAQGGEPLLSNTQAAPGDRPAGATSLGELQGGLQGGFQGIGQSGQRAVTSGAPAARSVEGSTQPGVISITGDGRQPLSGGPSSPGRLGTTTPSGQVAPTGPSGTGSPLVNPAPSGVGASNRPSSGVAAPTGYVYNPYTRQVVPRSQWTQPSTSTGTWGTSSTSGQAPPARSAPGGAVRQPQGTLNQWMRQQQPGARQVVPSQQQPGTLQPPQSPAQQVPQQQQVRPLVPPAIRPLPTAAPQPRTVQPARPVQPAPRVAPQPRPAQPQPKTAPAKRQPTSGGAAKKGSEPAKKK